MWTSLGICLMLVSGVALLIMHVSQMIPYRGGTHRHEDPLAYRRYWFIYLAMGVAGVVMASLGWLAG